MISKELLSEILGYEIDSILSENTSLNPNGENIVFKRDGRVKAIDIYKLAFKAKEWAIDLGYELLSGIEREEDYQCYVNLILFDDREYSLKKLFRGITETEAILKACEWIRQQQIKQGDK